MHNRPQAPGVLFPLRSVLAQRLDHLFPRLNAVTDESHHVGVAVKLNEVVRVFRSELAQVQAGCFEVSSFRVSQGFPLTAKVF